MAPRDVKFSGPVPTGTTTHHRNANTRIKNDDNDDDGETQQSETVDTTSLQDDNPKGWRKRILMHLKYVIRTLEDTGTESSSDSRRKGGFYYQGAGGMILILAAYFAYRHVSAGRRRLPLVLLSLLSSSTSVGSSSSHDHVTTDQDAVTDQSARRTIVIHQFWRFMGSVLSTQYHLLFRQPDHANAKDVPFSSLQTAARKGMVSRALIGPTAVVFSTPDNGWNRTALPTRRMQSDAADLLSEGGCNDISTLPESLGSKLVGPLLAALPFVYLAFVYRMLKTMHSGGMDGMGGKDFLSTKLLGTGSNGDSHRSAPKTRFSDVAGLDTILPELQEVVSYLQHPGTYRALGAEPPRGILLHGPPGAGKTLMAQAVAGEADCDAFVACSGSDFCELYVGRGASRVRALFQEARKVARQRYMARNGSGLGWRKYLWGDDVVGAVDVNKGDQPNVSRPATAIIFIDELDAVAKDRSHGGPMTSNDERDQTLNQLLTEMDGFFKDDDDGVAIIVIAATNRAQVLDPAILRRFDRQIFVPYPDSNGRKAVLKIHAAKTRCRFSTVNWDYLADQTPNFSGSDLKQVVNDAALLAVRQKSKQVDQSHLIHAIQRARATKVHRPVTRLDGGSNHFSSFGTSSSSPLFQQGRNNRHDKEPPLIWFPPEDN